MNQNLAQIIHRIDNLENRVETLEKTSFGTGAVKKSKKTKGPPSTKDINFSLNERAFVKRYASNKSGPRKFTILLAYLAHGNVDENVGFGEIEKCWNKMSAKNLLGKFNRFYPNEAKTRGWVDSKKHGSYNLTNEWKNVL